MQWTQVHQPIIHSTANKLLIQAFAGTGKTTTLLSYAIHHVSVKMRYSSYNKSVELAAKGRFPRNVRMQNHPHDLVYAVYGSQYVAKQTRACASPILSERPASRAGNWYATCSAH